MRGFVLVAVLIGLAGCAGKPHVRNFANDDRDIVVAVLNEINRDKSKPPTFLDRDFDSLKCEPFGPALDRLEFEARSTIDDLANVQRTPEEQTAFEAEQVEARATLAAIKRVRSESPNEPAYPEAKAVSISKLFQNDTELLVPERKETSKQATDRIVNVGPDLIAQITLPKISRSRRFALVTGTIAFTRRRRFPTTVTCLLEFQQTEWRIIGKQFLRYIFMPSSSKESDRGR